MKEKDMRNFAYEDNKTLAAVLPTINDLISYLTLHNDNIMVYVQHISKQEDGTVVYKMSNGKSYSSVGKGRWYVVSEQYHEFLISDIA